MFLPISSQIGYLLSHVSNKCIGYKFHGLIEHDEIFIKPYQILNHSDGNEAPGQKREKPHPSLSFFRPHVATRGEHRDDESDGILEVSVDL